MAEKQVYTACEVEVTDEGDHIAISMWDSRRPRDEEVEPDDVVEVDYVWTSGANTRPVDGGGYARISPHGYTIEVSVTGDDDNRRGGVELVSYDELWGRDPISVVMREIDRAMGEDDETREAITVDLEVDIGSMSSGVGPQTWLEVADAIVAKHSVSDKEFNRALGRVLDPDRRGEPASSLVNPSQSVPMHFVCELAHVVLEVPRDE